MHIIVSTRPSEVIVYFWSQLAFHFDTWTPFIFRSLGENPETAQVYLLSMSLAAYSTLLNLYFRYSVITSFTSALSRIISVRICFRNNITGMDLSMSLCIEAIRFSILLIVTTPSMRKRVKARARQFIQVSRIYGIVYHYFDHLLYHGKCFPSYSYCL